MSALSGYPAAFMESAICLSKAASFGFSSALGMPRPGKLAMTVSPILTLATVPAGASSLLYGMARFASQLFGMSQEVVNWVLPIGSNWKLQSFGSATTVIGFFA